MILLGKGQRTTLADISALLKLVGIRARTYSSNNHLVATVDGTRVNVWLGGGDKPYPKDLIPSGKALVDKLWHGTFDETTGTVTCLMPVGEDDPGASEEATRKIQFRIEPNGRHQRRTQRQKRRSQTKAKATSRRPEATSRRTKRPVRR